MPCNFFNEISDEWVAEKLSCINLNELHLEREIDELVRSKFETGPRHFTSVEFSKFLRWKGLARSIPAFLEKYNNSGEVEKITQKLFKTNLKQLSFADTGKESLRKDIMIEINSLFYHLQQLKFVKEAVASACLSLCFPDICVTADYIVPALLHNGHYSNGNQNPLFQNARTSKMLQTALIGPIGHSLSAYQARNIATRNYTRYVQEFWNIKRTFRLTEKVRKIEASIWSFGICYLSKGINNRGKKDDGKPLIFNSAPHPPLRGPFSKNCPNHPPGWDEARVRRVLAHYKEQTEEEAVAEDGAAFETLTQTAMEVPIELVPVVRELIAKHKTKSKGPVPH